MTEAEREREKGVRESVEVRSQIQSEQSQRSGYAKECLRKAGKRCGKRCEAELISRSKIFLPLSW